MLPPAGEQAETTALTPPTACAGFIKVRDTRRRPMLRADNKF